MHILPCPSDCLQLTYTTQCNADAMQISTIQYPRVTSKPWVHCQCRHNFLQQSIHFFPSLPTSYLLPFPPIFSPFLSSFLEPGSISVAPDCPRTHCKPRLTLNQYGQSCLNILSSGFHRLYWLWMFLFWGWLHLQIWMRIYGRMVYNTGNTCWLPLACMALSIMIWLGFWQSE